MFDTTMLPDTKNQPSMPVNTHILALLQIVQNTSDPWLLFLYVGEPSLSILPAN